MKIRLTLAALMLSSLSAYATVTYNFGAAELFFANASTPIPMNSLLQIIVSTTDNVFTPPTATSFTGGSADDVVWATFATNNNAGMGSFAGPLVLTLTGNITAGDQIMLRWWPTLTTGSSQPGGGTAFGQFRTDNVENFSNISWVVAADGSTVTLNFLDTAASGSRTNLEGSATFVVPPIPEPSSIALAALGALGLAGVLRRRAKR